MLPGLLLYFLFLLLAARWQRRGTGGSNDAFFRAGRRAPWPLVAVGMIAGSISGVSFVSVPGWVGTTGMTYLQMCLGFIFGYFAVAFLLLPLYYRLRLTSIYHYLRLRFGPTTHHTGAAFFLLSKLTGAAARLYLSTFVLHTFLTAPLGIPYPLVLAAVVALIWGYTRRSGQAALLYTDVVQTLALLLALAGLLAATLHALDLSPAEAWRAVAESPMSHIIEPSATHPQAFWRQFLSGVFIVIVMTGLDQDMMQKNLTCRNLRDAQKDMCSYGMAFLPVNALFLALGILLHQVCAARGLAVPAAGDALLPTVVASGALGGWVAIPFGIGIAAAACSAADGALTALTTSVCVDFFKRDDDVRLRRRVHLATALACYACILLFHALGGGSVIHTIYVMASYTYGPLLGLFLFGRLSRHSVRDRLVPAVALAAPLLCAVLDHGVPLLWGYRFGYELLLLNGLLTAGGLWTIRKGKAEAGRQRPHPTGHFKGTNLF